MNAVFSLAQGEVLNIAVGGQGQNNPKAIGPGGGGGGTFVLDNNFNPLLVAGGGGGGYNGGGGSGGSYSSVAPSSFSTATIRATDSW